MFLLRSGRRHRAATLAAALLGLAACAHAQAGSASATPAATAGAPGGATTFSVPEGKQGLCPAVLSITSRACCQHRIPYGVHACAAGSPFTFDGFPFGFGGVAPLDRGVRCTQLHMHWRRAASCSAHCSWQHATASAGQCSMLAGQCWPTLAARARTPPLCVQALTALLESSMTPFSKTHLTGRATAPGSQAERWWRELCSTSHVVGIVLRSATK